MGASLFIINHTKKQIIFNPSSAVYSDALRELLPLYLDLINSGKWSKDDNIEIENKCNLEYHDKDGEFSWKNITENDTYFSCDLDENDGCTCGIQNYQVIKVLP